MGIRADRAHRIVGVVLLALLGLAGPARESGAATPGISSSRGHTLALDATGQVYAWGDDSWGQLGSGRAIYRTTPGLVTGLPSIVSVAAGNHHVVALDASGNVWTWGGNLRGQLGRRVQPNPALPGKVRGILSAAQVGAGGAYSAALKSDGTVWVWGQFANSTSPDPRQLAGLSGITRIAAGTSHLLALKGDGTVWAVGSNVSGQLGDGTQTDRATAFAVPGVTGVTRIAAGYSQSLARKSDGTVLAWGGNYPWWLDLRLSALPVSGLTGVVDVAANSYSFAVKSDGTVVRWDNTYLPAAHSTFSGIQQFAVGAGASSYTSYGLTSAGALYTQGGNWVGQRGVGNTSFSTAVFSVTGIPALTHVSAGFYFAAARAVDGSVYVWGANEQGAMADGAATSRTVPGAVAGLPADIVAVKAGANFSLALRANGEVWAWGANESAQIGPPYPTPRSSPAVIPGLPAIAEMAAGCTHSLFRTTGLEVWFTGWISPQSSITTAPALEGGLAGITAIASGCHTAFAIRFDGDFHAWGTNTYGQLGTGNTTSTAQHTLVPLGADNAVSISIEQDHAVARTSAGEVLTWGRNTAGQLGDGTTANRSSPAKVAGLANVAEVSAGSIRSVARLADGTVKAWGHNGEGGLGDGTRIDRWTPVTVLLPGGITRIASGAGLSLALRSDGTLWGWGVGPTGDGTLARRLVPTLVLREGALGNLDGTRWYLDLDATQPDSLPPGSPPRLVAVANASQGSGTLSLDAAINFRAADYGKNAGTFIVGRVPAAFLSQVKLAPWMDKATVDGLLKNGDLIVVQLTPDGWATLGGQLIAYTSGVISGNGGANTILNNVDPLAIPGARFCIGYGESPASMLTSATLREVLTLEGAAADASGLPCLLSGVYVSGPASSRQGTSASFNAIVVGLSPTGSVMMKDGLSEMSAPLGLSLANEAVASAALSTSSLGVGVHSIGASYSGDGQNAAADAKVPLLHTVTPAASGTSVALSGPVSSSQGTPVTFVATVAGNAPTGTVQFRDGGADLGPAISLYGGAASLVVDTLAPGAHAITAVYGGDASNLGSTSPAWSHAVYAVLATSVELAASANPAAFGVPVQLTATVYGAAPTGSVTFRDGGVPFATVALTGGSASTTLALPGAGLHHLTADYGGDGGNAPASSPAYFLAVTAPPVDGEPAPFSLGGFTDVQPGAMVTSSMVPIWGINVPVAISVSGGEYSIGCAGGFTSSPGTVSNMQAVCVRHVASTTLGATTGTVLTAGGVSATFTSTTTTLDPAADADGDGIPNGVEAAEGRNPRVKDNDIFSPGAASARLFAMQMYRDFLGREGDAAGIQGWADAVAGGAWTRAQVIDGFLSSAEFAGFVAPVVRLYFATFLRVPDYDGLVFNAGLVRAGAVTVTQLADFFTASPEFAATYGALTDEQFVTLLYANVLGRAPDPAGLAGWVALLGGGTSRGQVLHGFSESAEYQGAMANEVFVTMMYAGMLRRTPEPAGFNGWVGFLDTATYTREQVIDGFFLSTEYRGRFLP